MNRILVAFMALSLPACARATSVAAVAESAIVEDKPAEGKHGTFADDTITVGDKKRAYRLVVPKAVDLAKPAPLVIAFHGMGIDSKDFMPKYTHLDEAAAEKKFILVYPQRDGAMWGIVPEQVKADLAFFDALLAQLQKQFKIDGNRIYVTGMSNGGYFAQLVAVERSKTIAAAMSHSSPLGLQTLGGIKAARRFPVLLVHGDQDKILPVEWTRDSRDKYKKEGHEVKYVEVAGLGHVWAVKEKINDTMWEFFAKHPLK